MTRKILTAASACIVAFATSKYFCGDALGALFWMSVASTTLIVATGPKA